MNKFHVEDDGYELPWATHCESEMWWAHELRPIEILDHVPITEDWIIPNGPWKWVIEKIP